MEDITKAIDFLNEETTTITDMCEALGVTNPRAKKILEENSIYFTLHDRPLVPKNELNALVEKLNKEREEREQRKKEREQRKKELAKKRAEKLQEKLKETQQKLEKVKEKLE